MDSVVIPEEVKKEIRSILLSKIGGVRLSDFQKDFSRYIGHPLDLKALKLNRLAELIALIPDVAVIARNEKDGLDYIRGVKDPKMFMNRTACKAQYKPRPGDVASQATKSTDGRTAFVEVDMNSEVVKQWSKELVPNRQGLYAVGCVKNSMIREDIDKIFSEFGDIVDVGLAAKYAFIRYRTKEEALRALVCLERSEVDLIIPTEKNASSRQDGIRKPDTSSRYNPSPCKTNRTYNNRNSDSDSQSSGPKWGSSPYNGVRNPDGPSSYGDPKKSGMSPESRKNSGDDQVEMFIGNIPFDASEDDLLTLFGDFNIVDIRLRGNDVKRFAFVKLPSAQSVSLVQKFHKKKHGRFDLVVATAINRTNTDATRSPTSNGLPKYENTPQKTQRFSCDSNGDHQAPPLPDPETELPIPDLESELQMPELERELQMPELERELQMPYLESDLQMPELEYAGDEYDQQGHYHREPVTYLANQYSRRPHLNNRSHLFVSNFPFGTNEMELLQLFAEFGAVYVRIKNSLNVERSTSALITFNSEEERDVAFINAYDTCFKNRPLVVNIAYSSKTPEEEFAMRVQIQPPADNFLPPADDFLPPADDFHENFLVTVPSDIEATSQRHVQKVNTPVNGVSQHAPRRQRAPLLVQTSSYTSQPAPLEADGEIFEEMAALSMHHPSNRMVHMSEPPPLEQY